MSGSTSKSSPSTMASLFNSNGQQNKSLLGICESKTHPLADEDDLMMQLDGDDVEQSVELGRRFLLDMRPECTKKYLDVIKEQLLQGEGETTVELGVAIDCVQAESGLTADEVSVAEENHCKLLSQINCVATTLLDRVENNGVHTKVVLVRRGIDETDFIEVRIAVVGNVDAGKSTLLGVLTHNILDDGRGHARKKLFRHKHEFESGRTSSVGNDILGFDVHGSVMNSPDPHSGHLDWVSICRDSAKVVTFIDLAGHEKYLKTTIFGMTGHMPDYTMLMIGANAGVIGTAREHLSLALSLNVPVFIVVTKIDMCPVQILNETLSTLDKLMKSPGARKRPMQIASMEDVVQAAHNFNSGKVCPIFQVSNVKGTNLDLLRSFLNIVPVSRVPHNNQPAEFQIDDIYWVEGIGTVVSGTCLAGKISLNDNMLIGPDSTGAFSNVPIKSIHRKRMPVSSIRSGQTASFALRRFTKKEVRKGMVMVSPALNPQSCFEFEAEVLILHHPTTIAPNYQAMIHAGSIRQTATILKIATKEVLRTGDRDIIRMRFIRQPEYLRVGTRMVFREGRTKAVGTIRLVHPYTSPVAQAQQSEKKGHGRQGASTAGGKSGGKTRPPKPTKTIAKKTS